MLQYRPRPKQIELNDDRNNNNSNNNDDNFKVAVNIAALAQMKYPFYWQRRPASLSVAQRRWTSVAFTIGPAKYIEKFKTKFREIQKQIPKISKITKKITQEFQKIQ